MRCLLEIIVARQADAYAVLKPFKDVAGLEFGVRLLNAIESSEKSTDPHWVACYCAMRTVDYFFVGGGARSMILIPPDWINSPGFTASFTA